MATDARRGPFSRSVDQARHATALGWPVEFLSPAPICARNGPDRIAEYDAAVAGGASAVTDDTQMTLYTAEGVLRSAVRNLEYWAQVYDREGFSGAHGPHPSVMAYAYR